MSSLFCYFLKTIYSCIFQAQEYLCDECGKSFRTAVHLSVHKRRHDKPKFKCPKCPREFFTPTTLRNHLEQHNNARFVCEICSAELTSRIGYMKHMGRCPKRVSIISSRLNPKFNCKYIFIFSLFLIRST